MDCGRECVRSGGDGRFLSRSPSCRRCSCRSLSRPVRWRQSRAGLNSRFASQQRDVGLDLVTSVAGPSCQRHMLTLPVGVDGGATGPDVVRMRRSIRIANPLVPAAERSCGPAFAITEFATDSPLEGTGFEPSVPLYGQLGTSGACDATHAAIVKLETSDRSRRRARRAICGTPGAPSARFPRDSGALDAKFDRRLASDTRIVFPPHVIWITLLSQPGTYIQGQ